MRQRSQVYVPLGSRFKVASQLRRPTSPNVDVIAVVDRIQTEIAITALMNNTVAISVAEGIPRHIARYLATILY